MAGIRREAVEHFFAAHVPGGDGPLRFSQISGGRSNITYRVDAPGGTFVLRRPPLGHVLPTAHDMAREYRVIAALARHRRAGRAGDRALRGHVGERRAVLRDGATSRASCSRRSCRRASPGPRRIARASATRSSRRSRSSMPSTSAPSASPTSGVPTAISNARCGAGRSNGSARRRVRCRRSTSVGATSRRGAAHVARADAGARRLPARQSRARSARSGSRRRDLRLGDGDARRSARRSRLHADLLDGARRSATSGTPFGASVTTEPGFATRAQLIEAYARATGRDVAAIDFYQVLALYKLAVISEGIYARFQMGKTLGPGFENLQRATGPLADRALAIADASQRRALAALSMADHPTRPDIELLDGNFYAAGPARRLHLDARERAGLLGRGGQGVGHRAARRRARGLAPTGALLLGPEFATGCAADSVDDQPRRPRASSAPLAWSVAASRRAAWASRRRRSARSAAISIDAIAPKGRCDFVAEVAAPLPMILIGDLLGVEPEDRQMLQRWSDELIAATSMTATPEAMAARGARVRRVRRVQPARRRRSPRAAARRPDERARRGRDRRREALRRRPAARGAADPGRRQRDDAPRADRRLRSAVSQSRAVARARRRTRAGSRSPSRRCCAG